MEAVEGFTEAAATLADGTEAAMDGAAAVDTGAAGGMAADGMAILTGTEGTPTGMEVGRTGAVMGGVIASIASATNGGRFPVTSLQLSSFPLIPIVSYDFSYRQ